ncbi:sensor histidine kinase [Vallitalea pronyensis]|uniref:histidine kinase n=1 Tax=Vallitalea pronyensis TaxID=1348613 RepID=A0A8J8MKK1_9FIRM|nr:sensor histidine kinase [Vallitalea pronyensis]QUI22943.1 sensor histidine kinase [Vallitalea pronyensis]
MKYMVKALIIGSIAFEMAQVSITSMDIIFFLLLITVTLSMEEVGRKWQTLIFLFECIMMIYMYEGLGFSSTVLTLMIFDSLYFGFYVGLLPVLYMMLTGLPMFSMMHHMLLFVMTGATAYVLKRSKAKEIRDRSILDNERRVRYDLEVVQHALIQSNKEIERLTEVKERNRIARDLHDNIGHSMAGMLMQLQAAIKILHTNKPKAEGMLYGCVTKLQTSLETIRDTVHNMYHVKRVTMDTLKRIIDQYTYCTIDATYGGNFLHIPENHFKVLSFVLKEALTNVSKHSGASHVQVHMTNTGKLLRMQIKDNGKGYQGTAGGVGLRIMRERIEQLDGYFSIDGENGTRIVCVIPVRTENEHENYDS